MIPWRERPWLSVKLAAEIAGLSDKTVRGLIDAGVLQRVDRCNRVFVDTTSFRRWCGEALDPTEPTGVSEISTVARRVARARAGRPGL